MHCRSSFLRPSVSLRWVVLLLPLVLAGCLSGVRQSQLAVISDQQRADAWRAFEVSEFAAALAGVKQAMHSAQYLSPTSEQVIEAYDDAGLYYYMLEDYAQSARHQAIAVLLAANSPSLQTMYPTYLQRLSWAWEKYRPDSHFAEIEADPKCLLVDADLKLATDMHIRQHFYRPSPWPAKALTAPWVRR